MLCLNGFELYSRWVALFNFKCLVIFLILIYKKIRLSLAAVCPCGPCKNCFANRSC